MTLQTKKPQQRPLQKVKGPWVQTASGRAVSLSDPLPEMIDFTIDIPEHLARIARFNGAARSAPYSVAQHCCIGADQLYDETRDRNLAAAFLLHDAHEAYLGDITTPVAQALSLVSALPVSEIIEALKNRLDGAIYRAAGVTYPLYPAVTASIADMDLRLLATERKHLLEPSPQSWGDDVERATPLRLVGRMRILAWPDAADEYKERLKFYLPRLTLPWGAQERLPHLTKRHHSPKET